MCDSDKIMLSLLSVLCSTLPLVGNQSMVSSGLLHFGFIISIPTAAMETKSVNAMVTKVSPVLGLWQKFGILINKKIMGYLKLSCI